MYFLINLIEDSMKFRQYNDVKLYSLGGFMNEKRMVA